MAHVHVDVSPPEPHLPTMYALGKFGGRTLYNYIKLVFSTPPHLFFALSVFICPPLAVALHVLSLHSAVSEKNTNSTRTSVPSTASSSSWCVSLSAPASTSTSLRLPCAFSLVAWRRRTPTSGCVGAARWKGSLTR